MGCNEIIYTGLVRIAYSQITSVMSLVSLFCSQVTRLIIFIQSNNSCYSMHTLFYVLLLRGHIDEMISVAHLITRHQVILMVRLFDCMDAETGLLQTLHVNACIIDKLTFSCDKIANMKDAK